jgi:membrane peptidoglycan carboxypeptidase
MTRRIRRAEGLDADSAARVDTVLRAMKRDGIIDKDQLAAAHAAQLKFQPVALPVEARRRK